ncbi:hypothetical protein KM043_010694 [Ampulex compressa]|nr:hypothetical protein KM043_010694 [Ampulex compressa]
MQKSSDRIASADIREILAPRAHRDERKEAVEKIGPLRKRFSQLLPPFSQRKSQGRPVARASKEVDGASISGENIEREIADLSPGSGNFGNRLLEERTGSSNFREDVKDGSWVLRGREKGETGESSDEWIASGTSAIHDLDL